MKFSASFYLIILVKLNLKAVQAQPVSPDEQGIGVCTQTYSYRASHYVPYLETYKEKAWGIFYETKVRVNYRIEYDTQYRTERVCCPGYVEIKGYCLPNCDPPCKYGLCTDPNVCICDSGYEEVVSSTDFVCHPVCKQNCGYGTCDQPDTCSCDSGYSTQKDGLTCQPHCDQDCEKHNATCIEPNTCACNFGYEKVDDPSDNRICQPHCEFPCSNGVCTAPNVCTCNKGYYLSPYDGLSCLPKCDNLCQFGVCIEPNVCLCSPGYKKISDYVCEPVCSQDCVMGKCIAPETCSCNEGYGFLDVSDHICYPICEKTCTNGNCTAPGVCTCYEGFQMMRDEFGEESCKPYCEAQCEPYGECTAPSTCKCFEGYHLVQKEDLVTKPFDFFADKSVCKPTCPEGCINGFCSSPNVCSCAQGYKLADHNTCTPICKHPCGPNTWCSSPNKCTCKEGYRLNRFFGYPSSSAKFIQEICVPICEVPCNSGATCTAPNNCTCDNGYRSVQGNETRCAPECTIDCGDGGVCTGPNNCTCHNGYQNDETDTCVPVSDPPRTFDTTTYPNVFSHSENNITSSDTELSCEENCINGECIGGQCFCQIGFVVKTNGSVTECTNCSKDCLLHGTCVDDEGTCECGFGFEGKNCEDATVCSFFVLDNITLINVWEEVNQSVFDAYIYSPYCFECADQINNDSLCFYGNKHPGDSSQMIRCIVSKDSPCYEPYEYNPLKAVVKVTGIVGGTAILIMCLAFTAAYISLRKSRKRDICRGRSQNTNGQERVGTESLLAEEAIQL